MANNYSKLTDKVNGRKIQVDSAVRDGLGNKIDTNYILSDGYYPQLGAGFADLADNLQTTTGITDDDPFVFQSSGGSQDIATGYAELKLLVGNTIKWNQLVHALNSTYWSFSNATGSFDNGVATFTATAQYGEVRTDTDLKAGHTYLVKAKIKKTSATSQVFLGIKDSYITAIAYTSETTDYEYLAGIRTIEVASSTNNISVMDYGESDFSSIEVREIQCFDLTEMFGLGNEPTTVLEFNRLFPKAYYDYTLSTLMSCKSASYKITGYNQLNESTLVLGQSISTVSGGTYTNADAIRSDYIRVIPNQKYTIEVGGSHASIYYCEYDGDLTFIKGSGAVSGTPIELSQNTQYLRISVQEYGSTYNNDICVHLTWSGSKTGYESYYSETYSLHSVELLSAGSAYDELKPDGTLIRRIKKVILTSDNFAVANYGGNSNAIWLTLTDGSDIKLTPYSSVCNVLTNKYTAISSSQITTTVGIAVHDVQHRFIIQDPQFDSSTEQGLESVKSSLVGMVIQYEMTEPTTEQTEYTYQETTKIDDYGTQEFLSNESIVVPQGNEIFYQKNLKDFLNRIGNRADIDYDPANIVSQTELQTAISQIPTPTISDKLDTSFTGVSEYDSTTTYTAGNKCWYNGKMYVANDTTTGEFDPTKWTEITLNDYVDLDSDQIFNVINASDIVGNTLTQAQYDLIKNGKPTLIKGTISNINVCNAILDVGITYGTNYFCKANYSNSSGTSFSSAVLAIDNNKNLSVFNRLSYIATDQKNALFNISQINGKEIPAYPSNTGTFVLKCINGTLTWVAE